MCEARSSLGEIEGNQTASGNDKESPFMSPPALASSLATALLLSHLSAPHYDVATAFLSISFSAPHPPSPLWICTSSIPRLVARSLTSAMLLSGVFCNYIWFGGRKRGCFCRRTATLSWGIILWAPSHLNADGNIFQWFNSTPCNAPNKDLFFCLSPSHPHTPLLCL